MITNERRRADVNVLQTALFLYSNDAGHLPRPTMDGELNADFAPSRNGLVDKYITKPVEPPQFGEWYCYGFSADGTRAFVATWLDVEDQIFVRTAGAEDFKDEDARQLLRAASRANFRGDGSCPRAAGFTVLRVQSYP